jgi:hypothetical protein
MENIIINGIEYTPVIKQSQIINKHYHFELHPDDLGKMTWDEAIKAVEKLGNGWRLPTIEELFMIYKNKLINNNTKSYWSSTEYANGYAWNFYFLTGTANYYFNNFKVAYVRAVRDLS